MKMRLTLMAVVVVSSWGAHAGQPWYGSETGEPYHWQNGVIEWVNDPGDLAKGVTNADAVKWVEESFDKWAKAGRQNPAAGGWVTTVDLHPTRKGTLQHVLSMDPKSDDYYLKVITNHAAYPTIVFDTKGEFIADLCAEASCDPTKIMAWTIVDAKGDLDPKTHTITHGVTLLNGTMVNTAEITSERFKASVVHEIGHLLGLDHSGLNDTYAVNKDRTKPADTAGAEKGIPTMYPANVSEDQANLHNDDVIAISSLYPASAFSSQFCTITGKIVDSKGEGIQGIEVVAWAESPANTLADSMSTMTGANFPVPTRDGHYYIRGVVPKRSYAVSFGGLPKFSSSGSAIGTFDSAYGVTAPDLGTPPITTAAEGICFKGSDSCQITTVQGTIKDVSCDKGGQVIVMDTTTLDSVTVDEQYATAPSPVVSEPTPPAAPAASGGSGCTLIR